MTTIDRPRCRFYTATTLDGFLATEDDSLDWLLSQDTGGQGPDSGDGTGWYEEFFAGVGALVMGATTYLWVLDHLRSTGETWSQAWPYDRPTFVFTHRELDRAADSVQLVAGSPPDLWPRIADAAGDRDVWMVGGGELAVSFAASGLLDDVLVSIAPVTLGAGKPLFPRPFDLHLRGVEQQGVFVFAQYGVVGPRAVEG
ncbi:dihydrofolate reductase family protein [Aeromicrobium sp. CTD01-1L150]|uniref:dihydrofolate reductase family protein n=1 Tax=Aeromicrobium sp. CTD01-1L150 TaxID=3341830 RepID=UPI0035C1440F